MAVAQKKLRWEGEFQMLYVMARCSVTQRSYSTGLVMDRRSFEALPAVARAIHCPFCGTTHEWKPGEAWLETEPPPETSVPWLVLNNRSLPND